MSNATLPTATHLPASGIERAALAFSVLSSSCAEVVNRRLTIGERMRLREGLARVRDASDDTRIAAVRVLAQEVRRGMEWPRPSVHDDADCPFGAISSHPKARVVDVFGRIAAREPLQVAVALCHLPAGYRNELWNELSVEARGAIAVALEEVHWVSTVQTRAYARDIIGRLSRAIRSSPLAMVR